jgi:hypothetical protein
MLFKYHKQQVLKSEKKQTNKEQRMKERKTSQLVRAWFLSGSSNSNSKRKWYGLSHLKLTNITGLQVIFRGKSFPTTIHNRICRTTTKFMSHSHLPIPILANPSLQSLQNLSCIFLKTHLEWTVSINGFVRDILIKTWNAMFH